MNSLSQCRSFVVSRLVRNMSSSNYSYEKAIRKLNLLQSNKATIEQIRREIKAQQRCTNLESMENYLKRIGVPLTKLDELSVIHVAGTKGKGSTSAMCEAVLRSHGFRTGLFTSPHLVAVRERIRLDGLTVSREKFAKHFHEVYDLLDKSQAFEGDMPKYFGFLTVLAFNVFLREKVDVAIVEVGIGGVVDFTNVLRKVPIVGITALGLDHTSILGDTIEQIALAKAGIMKPGCEAYTVRQPKAAQDVLEAFARNVGCTLTTVPDFKDYTFPKESQPELPVDLEAYRTNASLAIQLSHAWMRHAKIQTLNRRNTVKKQMLSGKIMRQNDYIEIESSYYESKDVMMDSIGPNLRMLPSETVNALRECRWPGRYQVIRSDNVTYYLDGAHTKESVEICAKWFVDNNRYRNKILIFTATGDRDVEVLLTPLKDINFKSVFFVIPKAYKQVTEKNDNYSILENKDLIAKCRTHAEIWNKISAYTSNVKALECVSDALLDVENGPDLENPSVLITGSLHLVGAALSILDPSLSKD